LLQAGLSTGGLSVDLTKSCLFLAEATLDDGALGNIQIRCQQIQVSRYVCLTNK
jgi:hypothetical protein